MTKTNKDWQVGTLLESHPVAENVMAMTFDLPEFAPFMPGQHCDIRLTAPGGYQAERSYSIASPPERPGKIEFGIQLLKDGEVSPYLWSMKPGQQCEIRGPIGGHFTWDVSVPGPLVLIGGGSGMVPLMSMLRHRALHLDMDRERDVVFLVSARKLDFVLYRDELADLAKKDPKLSVVMTITDMPPAGWTGYTRRIDEAMLRETVGRFAGMMPMAYVCGPTAFVEAAANAMLALGYHSHEVKTERFG